MEPIVSIRNLVNAFGKHVVHDQLCLDVFPGEILGIVGGSGTGKSVLMRSMLGLRKPQSGEIHVLGHDIQTVGSGLQQRWGVLFQNGALFSALTVRQNAELPIALHSNVPAATRRELAQLKVRMTGLPLSALDKYPSELSGGMIKRAALARALALEPDILFLDEPTAGLDPIGATRFDNLVTYLRASLNLTIIMVTHDMDSLFGLCDRVAVLVDKKVVVGTLDEILQSPHPWIRSYFNDPRAVRARQKENKNVRAN
ncbi:MAG: ATP-binding cassette domain-containing protein [Gammaproteobacteria bacterium]|nr:ATP-binding cassette domain-containing protein [Gammaproteobacteria bacterium]